MAAEEKEKREKLKKLLSKGTIFNIAVLGIIAFGIFFCYYGLYRQAKNIYPTNNRIAETLYTICHPLKEEYDIKDYHVKPFSDGSMGVEYIINDPEQAFDIVREIDTLRKDSIYLSKALIHIRIKSTDSAPDGVDFRVELPGEYGYESKRDDELYLKLDVDQLKWREVQKEIREKYPETEETDADKDADADAGDAVLPGDTESETS